MVHLPLRVTTPCILAKVLTLPDNTSLQDLELDLQRLDQLRQTIAQGLQEQQKQQDPSDCQALLDNLTTYAAALEECQDLGLQVNDDSGGLSWSKEAHASLVWERCNVLYNIIALTAYQASEASRVERSQEQSSDSTKAAWTKAGVEWQNAAALCLYLQSLLKLEPSIQSPCLSNDFIQLVQAILTAHAQRAAYHAFGSASRPRQFMLAKLAAAAVPLFSDVQEQCEHLDFDTTSGSTRHEEEEEQVLSRLVRAWEDAARAWNMYLSAVAELHQACAHAEKKEWGPAICRLRTAVRFGQLCRDFCDAEDQEEDEHDVLLEHLKRTLPEMQARLEEYEAQHPGIAVPDRDELPEIAPQSTVNVEKALAKAIPASPQPFFRPVSNHARIAASFCAEVEQLLANTTRLAEEKTERGRQALATVNLPHSLTAYRQEQAGGGIPPELWERVQAFQRDERLIKLKQDLWDLRDSAETARVTYQSIEQQLEQDLEMDHLFRQEHRGFDGHDAIEIQKTFRQSLENYSRLLAAAQDGDSVLLRRLEILDTDPKYKLLQFQKSQLDRLLPKGRGNDIDVSVLSRYLVELSAIFSERERLVMSFRDQVQSFDVEQELSQAQAQSGAGDADQQARSILDEAHKVFMRRATEIEENVEAQTELIHRILEENQLFMRARDANHAAASSGDSCIVMMEDAMDEIEQLGKHLDEGRDFYRVITPKLNKLRQQVGDVSARLTVERCEFEDRARRNRQESEDARVAATYRGVNGSGNTGEVMSGLPQPNGMGGSRMSDAMMGGSRMSDAMMGGSRMSDAMMGGSRMPDGMMGGGMAGPMSGGRDPYSSAAGYPISSSSQHEAAGRSNVEPVPGVEAVSHNEPVVRVDDEKVASLVAMDFDPERVVAALRKYDNNFEQALNDLLSC